MAPQYSRRRTALSGLAGTTGRFLRCGRCFGTPQRFLLAVSKPGVNSMFHHKGDRASLELFAASKLERAPVLLRSQSQSRRNRYLVAGPFGEHVDAAAEINESVPAIVPAIDYRSVPPDTEMQPISDVSCNRIDIISVDNAVRIIIGQGSP
jgi:hypothetical protein